MKIRLHLTSGEVRKAAPPAPDAPYAIADGACPRCGSAPFRVQGTGKRIASHDTYAADAVATCCDQHVGELRATVSTLFGLREDEAVTRYVTLTVGGKVY